MFRLGLGEPGDLEEQDLETWRNRTRRLRGTGPGDGRDHDPLIPVEEIKRLRLSPESKTTRKQGSQDLEPRSCLGDPPL